MAQYIYMKETFFFLFLTGYTTRLLKVLTVEASYQARQQNLLFQFFTKGRQLFSTD